VSGYELRKIGPDRPPAARPGELAPVRVVVASTLDRAEFHENSFLGQSLSRIPKSLRPALSLSAGNQGSTARGLSQIYNEALDEARDGDILVFVHDDVYLHDWQIVSWAREAMTCFDLAGIAGALDPDSSQPSWCWRGLHPHRRRADDPGRRSCPSPRRPLRRTIPIPPLRPRPLPDRS
jgi:hypothetical protein